MESKANVLNQPPTEIEVSGVVYAINSDFRVWIEVAEMLQSLDFSMVSEEENANNLKLIAEISKLVFGEVIPQFYGDILAAVAEFFHGYPQCDNGYKGGTYADNVKLYDFKHDLNYIVLAIRNQSGIDLSYKSKTPLHWWDFCLEFSTLTEGHFISRIMGYRGYKGEDKDYIKLRETFALPTKLKHSEAKIFGELEELLYDT